MNKIIENNDYFRPVKSFLGKSFIVKDYQRGYKWDVKEILELLNDFDNHDINNGKYCLQPIIVRENSVNNSFELIDGQQRVTSLYLLLVYLSNSEEIVYDISYETRLESKVFLSRRILELNEYIEKNLKWEDFISIEGFEIYDNVDIYHFYEVYKTIYNWFKLKPDNFKNEFKEKVLNTVHIIWYDIDQSENIMHLEASAEQVFLNLNAGKIPLTSSELIKALFILECQSNNTKEIYKIKAIELASEWDLIENALQDNSFWFFICDNDKYNSSSTRIDFLFDIINDRKGKDDELFSYRIYEKRFKEGVRLNWLEVKNTFNKLIEWHHDKELYHYIGFLIVSNIKGLKKILEKSKGITKSKFKLELLKWIETEFLRKKKNDTNEEYFIYQLDNLDYRDSRKECEKLLILLNINYYINNLSSNKFPFELYKGESWSVEHINPQNPRDFRNIGNIKEWLIVNENYFEKAKLKNNEVIGQLAIICKYFENIETSDKRKLAELKFDKIKVAKLEQLIDSISYELDLHGISNLALLDKNSNSKLSNKLFLEKRELILKFDQEGKYIDSNKKEKKVYIPVCTKNVFSKIYTMDKESVANSFFGKEDIDSYYIFIESQLKSFLPNLNNKN